MSNKKTKTVRDLLKLLEGIDPDTELWTQDTRDDNECFPVVNLPAISTIALTTLNYYSGGSKKIWVVRDEFVEDEDIEDSKVAIVWND